MRHVFFKQMLKSKFVTFAILFSIPQLLYQFSEPMFKQHWIHFNSDRNLCWYWRLMAVTCLCDRQQISLVLMSGAEPILLGLNIFYSRQIILHLHQYWISVLEIYIKSQYLDNILWSTYNRYKYNKFNGKKFT